MIPIRTLVILLFFNTLVLIKYDTCRYRLSQLFQGIASLFCGSAKEDPCKKLRDQRQRLHAEPTCKLTESMLRKAEEINRKLAWEEDREPPHYLEDWRPSRYRPKSLWEDAVTPCYADMEEDVTPVSTEAPLDFDQYFAAESSHDSRLPPEKPEEQSYAGRIFFPRDVFDQSHLEDLSTEDSPVETTQDPNITSAKKFIHQLLGDDVNLDEASTESGKSTNDTRSSYGDFEEGDLRELTTEEYGDTCQVSLQNKLRELCLLEDSLPAKDATSEGYTSLQNPQGREDGSLLTEARSSQMRADREAASAEVDLSQMKEERGPLSVEEPARDNYTSSPMQDQMKEVWLPKEDKFSQMRKEGEADSHSAENSSFQWRQRREEGWLPKEDNSSQLQEEMKEGWPTKETTFSQMREEEKADSLSAENRSSQWRQRREEGWLPTEDRSAQVQEERREVRLPKGKRFSQMREEEEADSRSAENSSFRSREKKEEGWLPKEDRSSQIQEERKEGWLPKEDTFSQMRGGRETSTQGLHTEDRSWQMRGGREERSLPAEEAPSQRPEGRFEAEKTTLPHWLTVEDTSKRTNATSSHLRESWTADTGPEQSYEPSDEMDRVDPKEYFDPRLFFPDVLSQESWCSDVSNSSGTAEA